MKQHLLTHYKGRPMMIVGHDRHWAARLIGRSFSLWLHHYYKHAFVTSPEPGKIQKRTFRHELGHTGDVQDFADKLPRWLKWIVLPWWLAGYFGKRLLRRLCFAIGKGEWAPRDVHEDFATEGEAAPKGFVISAEADRHFA